MTEQEINIAIAESLGWKRGKGTVVSLSEIGSIIEDGWINPDNEEFEVDVYPYCQDLNAMHEVEETLYKDEKNPSVLLAYCSELSEVCGYSAIRYIHATALQRAEAYLHTKGLWKGE